MILLATETKTTCTFDAGVAIVRLLMLDTAKDHADLKAMIERTGSDVGIDPYQTGRAEYWMIEVDGERVGYTGVHSIDFTSRRCRGIIWVAPEYRRQGIATEAVRLRNNLLFDRWNMNRVEWAVSLDNQGSQLFSKSRSYAHHEGTLKEAVYYDGRYHDVALYALTRRQRDLMLDKRNAFTNPGQGEAEMGGEEWRS